MTDIRQQIANHLRRLEGERVKALVLDWLAETDGSLTDFERLIEAETGEADVKTLTYGELNEGLNFHSLTEAEMIEKSLEALDEYRRTGNGISHEHMREWVDSLGTDREFPCPR
jgi:hypothetical protein